MPKVVENYIYVLSDNRNHLNSFMEEARSEDADLSLNKLYPCPEGAYENLMQENLMQENLSTTYVKVSTLRYQTNLVLCYYLETLMIAPADWLKQIAILYPHLGFFMRSSRDGIDMIGSVILLGEYNYAMVYDERYLFKTLYFNLFKKFVWNRNKMVKDFAAFDENLLANQKIENGFE